MARTVLATLMLMLAVQAAPAALTPVLPSLAMPANGDLVMSDTLTGRRIVTEVAGTTIPQVPRSRCNSEPKAALPARRAATASARG